MRDAPLNNVDLDINNLELDVNENRIEDSFNNVELHNDVDTNENTMKDLCEDSLKMEVIDTDYLNIQLASEIERTDMKQDEFLYIYLLN